MSDASKHNEPRRIGDIAPVGAFVERARGRVDFDRGAGREFDETDVPRSLRHLIPLVRCWGFADNGAQADFLEHLQTTDPPAVDAFVAAVAPHRETIHDWVTGHVDTGSSAVNQAVAAFCNLSEMYDLAKPLNHDRIAQNRRRAQQRLLERERLSAIERSRTAIAQRDFEAVVRLLEPYEAELSGADRQRLSIAKKRTGRD